MSNYKSDPANVYYTANFINKTDNNVAAELTTYKTVPIINSPGEYYLKINEFYISNVIIPLLFMDDETFSVTIDATSTGGTSERVYLQFINSSSNPALDGYVFYLQTFMTMVNLALFNAHALSSAIGNPPRLIYNENGYFSMLMDETYVINGTEIWFNTFLAQKFASFNYFFNRFQNNEPLGDGKVYRFVRAAIDIDNYFPSGYGNFTYPLYKYDQPYPSLFYLSDIRRLLVTSNQMPNLRQIYSTSIVSSTIQSNPSILSTRGVLFTVPVDDSFKSNSASIFYTPPVDKLIDMVSQEPMSIIDIKIFYELKNGDLLPVQLAPGSAFTIEFAFVHKSINDNAYTFNKLGM